MKDSSWTIAYRTSDGQPLERIASSEYQGAEIDFASLIERYGHEGIEVYKDTDGETLDECRGLFYKLPAIEGGTPPPLFERLADEDPNVFAEALMIQIAERLSASGMDVEVHEYGEGSNLWITLGDCGVVIDAKEFEPSYA